MFAEFKIKKSSPSNAIKEEYNRLEESSTPAVKPVRPKSAFKVVWAWHDQPWGFNPMLGWETSLSSKIYHHPWIHT